jgi:hypothetical protein
MDFDSPESYRPGHLLVNQRFAGLAMLENSGNGPTADANMDNCTVWAKCAVDFHQ